MEDNYKNPLDGLYEIVGDLWSRQKLEQESQRLNQEIRKQAEEIQNLPHPLQAAVSGIPLGKTAHAVLPYRIPVRIYQGDERRTVLQTRRCRTCSNESQFRRCHLQPASQSDRVIRS